MNDRELLELAAKAAGHKIGNWIEAQGFKSGFATDAQVEVWNPLTDDGDALRLAVKLQLTIENDHLNSDSCCVSNRDDGVSIEESSGLAGDSISATDYATTRRAIVRAAAEIGRGMP